MVAIGATTPESLARKRPYVIVGVFVAGMLLTPPDVVSQTLLAIPMWLLFELGIFFSRFFQRQRASIATERNDTDDVNAQSSTSAAYARANAVQTSDASVVGRDIDGGNLDESGRFRPLTAEEMEAELDAIEAEEAAEEDGLEANELSTDPVAVLLTRANELRAQGNLGAARHLLYRVLEDGDDDQRRVARNILADLDRD